LPVERAHDHIDGDIFGMYFFREEFRCIFPDKACQPFNKELEVSEWYIMINGQLTVSHDKFLRHSITSDRYDNDHHIISLDHDSIKKLSDLSVKI